MVSNNGGLFPVDSSLISTGSRVGAPEPIGWSFVQRAQILSVLSSDAFDNLPQEAKPSDCFRPQYFGKNSKEVLHCTTNMNKTFSSSIVVDFNKNNIK